MRLVAITASDQHTCYVVLDEHGHLVEPIARYLKHLDQRGYARNTLRAYGTSLALFSRFSLNTTGRTWRSPSMISLTLCIGSAYTGDSQPI